MRIHLSFLYGFFLLSFSSFYFSKLVSAFVDDFDAPSLGPEWQTYYNLGSVTLVDSSLKLDEGGFVNTFPYVRTISNDIFENFSQLDLVWSYTDSGHHGTGIAVGHGFAPPNLVDDSFLASNLYEYYLFNIHQDNNGPGHRLVIWMCSNSEPGCTNPRSVINIGSAPDTQKHSLKTTYSDNDGVYNFYLGDSEGENMNLVFTTSTDQPPPKVLWIGNPVVTALPGQWYSLSVDKLTVESTSQTSNILDVADFKQYDPLWGGEIYDSADKWAPGNESIAAWGCALTSAAMVLDYHGYPVTPLTLNQWLRGQRDGYIRNGLVNWLAISRYTRQNPNGLFDALEYRRFRENDFDQLDIEIAAERPAILREPGHFVVAKGRDGGETQINDPAFAEKTTLTSYGDMFEGMGSYVPSNTDLSYLMLVVDEDVDLEVVGPEGLVEGYEYVEGPVVDDASDSGQVSGETLKVFMYPTPTDGSYQILTSEDGFYNLDAYLYDENGDFQLEGFLGGFTSEFSVRVGEDGQISREVSYESLLEDWRAGNEAGLISSQTYYEWVVDRLNEAAGSEPFESWLLRRLMVSLKLNSPRTVDNRLAKEITEGIKVLIGSFL